MINFKKIKLVVFYLFFSIIAVNANEIDCDNQNNIICYFEEAEKIALLHDESDDYLDDEIYIRAQEFYNKFLNYIENNNHSFENEALISAYINVARVNGSKNKFSDFDLIEKNISNYNKAYKLGAQWSTYLLCNTLFEVYEYNNSNDINESLKEKLNNYLILAKDSCHKFIDEKSNLDDIYLDEYGLSRIWNLETQKYSLFEVSYNLMWIYEELNDSLKTMEYAFKAENVYNARADWDLTDIERVQLSNLYNLIGHSYEYNYGVVNNPSKAINYYQLSANLDNEIAITNLSEVYRTGKYGELDFNKAIDLLNQSIELEPKNSWAFLYLGEIYLYGFGVEIDVKKAKLYFDKVKEINEYYKANSEDYYSYTLSDAQSAFDLVEYYLITWDSEKKTHSNSSICADTQTYFESGYPSFHLFKACKDLANRNVLSAKKYIIDFYKVGIVVPQNAELAFQMANELIVELEQAISSKNWNKFLPEEDLANYTESEYSSDYLNYIEVLQSNNANSIFFGSINKNSEIAYDYLDKILNNNRNYLNPFQKPNEDLWYQSDWYMYNLMKIDGWGTKQDLETVGKTIDSLEKNFKYLNDNPEKIDDLHNIRDVQQAIRDLEYVKDKYTQAKSGYSIRSKILFAFPATYTGQVFWTDGSDQSIEIEIKKAKKLGYEDFSISGLVKYLNDEDKSIDEQYLLEGKLVHNNGMVIFDELDIGDRGTLDSYYGSGKYYGKFNEDYSSFTGQFVFKDETSGHAHVEVFKEEDLVTSIDYKKSIGIGKQYALLIGNNDYENLSKLETATADARSLADVLQNKYGFIVDPPLINATRNEILMKLSYLSNALNPEDSLLIFYAGHGRQDEDTGRGYWSPIDAFADNFINDISNDDITNTLKKINSKHILVIADSCYSGTLVLRGKPVLNRANDISYLKELAKKESRKALTSGALQPVSDTGENGHSAFANSLLKVLVENKKIISANELHQNIRPLIMTKYSQTPLYNVVGNAGDKGGEFLFIPIQ